ncbi:MAG: MATE family efflux transporter [Acidobacteria bacterium]|nr:MATE family efflux transporter [Acidobacteriota bacterium]
MEQVRARWWSAVAEALRGGHVDYTAGNLDRALLLLAIPMILETAMESLFAVVDIYFVSKLGADAMATVALTESLVVLVIAVALGLSFSTTAFVARRIGERNPAEAARGAAQSVLIGAVSSALIGLIGLIFAPELLGLMGATPGILKNVTFSRIVLGGCGTLMMLFLLNAIFRGAGDAVIAMRVLWLANIINILLNPCLIFGLGPFPELGIAGSGVGTVIGRGSGVLYQLWLLRSGAGRIHIRASDWKPNKELLRHILRPALNGMFQIFIATASWTGLVRIAATFGATALAGYTIGIRVIMFSIMPSWGLSNAAATLVGQNLGAAKPERAEAAVWRAGFYNAIFLGALSLVFMLLPELILGVFTDQAAVLEAGAMCLRYISSCYVFYAYGMMMLQAFNGAGDTATPTRINLIAYWVVQIPLAWTLAHTFDFGPRGMYGAVALAELTVSVLAILYFRQGRWKRAVI